MAKHDIVVIGASAGGIAALTALVAGLPRDLPAALCVVVHIPPYATSRLPEILTRAGPLPATHARDGEALEPGRVYVAPPDRHLLVRPGWLELQRGPRENHSRPAIDPLFRTAARAYGARVVGIVLSGALYDGSAGLLAVQMRGGITVVQDPDEAVIDSMPRSALKLVAADYVLPAAAMGPVLVDLARQPAPQQGGSAVTDDEERLTAVIADDFAAQAADGRAEEVSIYTCPECGGVLWQDDAGPPLQFRCHVGHAYAPELLLSQKSEEVEAALWASVRLLREKATLSRQLAVRSRTGSPNGTVAERVEEQAEADERHATTIRELLESMPSPVDPTGNGDRPPVRTPGIPPRH